MPLGERSCGPIPAALALCIPCEQPPNRLRLIGPALLLVLHILHRFLNLWPTRIDKMNRILGRTLLVIGAIGLASCGGGGGDDSPTTQQATSFWTMDAYRYVNGGNSAQTTSPVGGRPLTIVVASTATLSGGDKSNGAYSGSSISFAFSSTGPGTYNIVRDSTALLNSPVQANAMTIESVVGIGVTTGSSKYAATSGQVVVSQDAAGKFHFQSVGSLPTNNTQDVLGGIVGAPATMALVIRDVF